MIQKNCGVKLLWDDLLLTVINPPLYVLKEMRMQVKDFRETPVLDENGDPRGWNENKIVRSTEKLYTKLERKNFPVAVTMMQGFKNYITDLLQENGTPYKLVDLRIKFPEPDFRKIQGTQNDQKGMVIRALSRNQSGLIGAPTRYGKLYVGLNILRCFPGLTRVMAMPGKDLIRQSHSTIKEMMPGTNVVKIGGGKGSSKYPAIHGVTICSVDSLHKCDAGQTDLLLGDEVHALVAPSRIKQFSPFHTCRRIGLGATLKGRFDGRDPLITGLFGPVLENKTYEQAVIEGAICPLVILMVRVKIPIHDSYTQRNTAYNHLLFRNQPMAKAVGAICKDMLPPDYQTLLFIKSERQANLYLKHLPEDATIAMAKVMTEKSRDAIFDRMAIGEIKRCLATNIYSQGVTFPDLRVMINLEGGGNNCSAIQKPGRLCQVRPGKKYGVIIDFDFQDDGYSKILRENKKPVPAWSFLMWDSMARRTAYEEKGYKVVDCADRHELKEKLEQYL